MIVRHTLGCARPLSCDLPPITALPPAPRVHPYEERISDEVIKLLVGLAAAWWRGARSWWLVIRCRACPEFTCRCRRRQRRLFRRASSFPLAEHLCVGLRHPPNRSLRSILHNAFLSLVTVFLSNRTFINCPAARLRSLYWFTRGCPCV